MIGIVAGTIKEQRAFDSVLKRRDIGTGALR